MVFAKVDTSRDDAPMLGSHRGRAGDPRWTGRTVGPLSRQSSSSGPAAFLRRERLEVRTRSRPDTRSTASTANIVRCASVTPGTSRDIAGGRRRSSMEVEEHDGIDL